LYGIKNNDIEIFDDIESQIAKNKRKGILVMYSVASTSLCAAKSCMNWYIEKVHATVISNTFHLLYGVFKNTQLQENIHEGLTHQIQLAFQVNWLQIGFM